MHKLVDVFIDGIRCHGVVPLVHVLNIDGLVVYRVADKPKKEGVWRCPQWFLNFLKDGLATTAM